MADIVSRRKRSAMMSRIRGKDTRPELLIRKALFGLGYRYRLHARNLPGKPDLILPRYKAVFFIHGCFWHQHDCHLFKWPSTRADFWREKIEGNSNRDQKNAKALSELGWRICTVWECALKGKTRRPVSDTIDTIDHWLKSDRLQIEIRGME